MKCTALLLAAAATAPVQAFQPVQLPQQRQQVDALSMSYLDSLGGGSAPAPAKSYAPSKSSKPSAPAAAAGGAKGGTVPDDSKLFGHVPVAPVAASYVAPSAQWGENPTYLDDSKPYSCYSEYEIMDANSNNPYVGNRYAEPSNANTIGSWSALPSPSLIAEYTDFAQQLAQVAGATILPFWRRPIDVENKGDESPVTIADRSAELAMRTLIQEEYPDHGIIGEEYGSEQASSELVWILDPIDGTKSFITGKPLFGTLISLLHRGTPLIGIIDQCILKERWVGSIGNPTTLNGQIVRTSPSARKLENSILYNTSPDMFSTPFEKSVFNNVRETSKLTLYGCDCYAYALVASGFGADGVIEAGLGLYDYCSLVPILEGAGGVITDWNGRPLNLQNHELSEGRVIAASNSELHSDMLRAIGEVRS